MPLFNRRAVLQVEGRDLSDFRFGFDVSKNLTGRPNKAQVTAYNLAEGTRRFLSDAAERRIVLLAGYVSETPHAVFVGRLERIEHVRQGADWVTTISGGNSQPRAVRVSLSLGRGATMDKALNEITRQVGAAGVGLGNAPQVARGLAGRSVGAGGLSISASADVALDALLEELGLEWSIQDDQLQILERGKARQVQASVLSSDTGMVGTPEVLEKGRLRARSLIAPGLDPGLLVRVDALQVSGFYRVDSARYRGDTWGQEWYIEMELRPVS